MDKNAKIYVAGHTGMVGSALVRALSATGYENLLLRTHQELDLKDQASVHEFFRENSPAYVFMAAARVGGIQANAECPADFLMDNLQIQSNVFSAAHLSGTAKLLFLGSSCVYPRECPMPIKEEYLLTGSPEPTNEAYALAKIAGIKACAYYRRQHGFHCIGVMPANSYGPGDNFDPAHSHVIPALIRRFHEAKEDGMPEVVLWGTGDPMREFLHVDDLAEACLFLMTAENASDIEYINIGSTSELSIRALAEMIRDIVGYDGKIAWDTSKPDGMPRRIVDSSKMVALGWTAKRPLAEGLQEAYQAFLEGIRPTNRLRSG
jgi:GDP-L-fucose synthase